MQASDGDCGQGSRICGRNAFWFSLPSRCWSRRSTLRRTQARTASPFRSLLDKTGVWQCVSTEQNAGDSPGKQVTSPSDSHACSEEPKSLIYLDSCETRAWTTGCRIQAEVSKTLGPSHNLILSHRSAIAVLHVVT